MTGRNDWWTLDECGLVGWKDRGKEKEMEYKVKGNTTVSVKSEYFQVFCGNTENYFVQNVKKPEILPEKHTENRMNLIVFQIDNLSRAHFMRTMKETSSKIRDLVARDVVEYAEMLRVVTVGFNTEPNTKAMYTGSQFRQGRAGRPYWDIFHSQGNVAAYINGTFHSGFCEDWANRFLKRDQFGLDHYVFMPWCHPDYHPYNRTFSLLTGVNAFQRRCISGTKVHQRIFAYLFDFWDNYPNQGKIVHIPFQEAHEGSGAVVTTLDPDFAGFIEEMEKRGELNRTIIVIASDHGSLLMPYYYLSAAGALEQVMPGVRFLIPKEFARKYPELVETLKSNQQRLVVHYDTYWTLRHLSTLPEFGGSPTPPEEGTFTSVWDCEGNEKYMKDIWYFRNKEFYNVLGWKNHSWLVERVFEKLHHCIETYMDPEPVSDPMNHALNLTTSGSNEEITEIYLKDLPNTGSDALYYLTVQNFIKDYESIYWFEDALSDMWYASMRYTEEELGRYVARRGNQTEEVEKETQAYRTLVAPGLGRYVYGRSLMKYSDDRDCNSTGVWECPCRP